MSDKDKKTFKRKFISLEVKIQILDRLLKGEKASHIGKSLNLSEATVRTIKKNEKEIRSAVAAGSSISAKYSARSRAPIIEKMEKALSIWIYDSCQKRISLDGNIIKQKALKIYKHLKEHGESSVNPDFVASKGWLEKFKKRFGIHSMKIQREIASADHEAARAYSEKIQNIIEEQGYTAHQVFNASETGLWWKKMSSRTFILKKEKTAPGFKASKSRITLVLCSNASGDFMTKPMLVYRSLSPHALRGVNKNTLPVYWKANPRAWVTRNIFKDWFLNCFVPNVENYLKRKNLSFKALLLLDNAPCHLQDLSHPNVKIVFLTPLFQPLDQGIIYTFKTYYIRRALQWILDVSDSKSINVMEAWKQFSIKHCIDIVALSLKELTASTLNACWKKIWPSSVEVGNVLESSENEICGILELAKSIGGEDFVDMAIEDVQDLLVEEVDEADLMAYEVGNQIDSEDNSSDEDCEVNNLTLKKLEEGLSLAESLESFFLNADSSAERKQKFKRELQNCLSSYHEIYNDLVRTTKQTKSTDFLNRMDGAKNLNGKEGPDSESDIVQPRKRSRLIVHTELSDKEEID